MFAKALIAHIIGDWLLNTAYLRERKQRYQDAPRIDYNPNSWDAEELDKIWGKIYQ